MSILLEYKTELIYGDKTSEWKKRWDDVRVLL